MFHSNANSLSRAEVIFLGVKQQIKTAVYMEVGVKYILSLKARADFSLRFGGSRIESTETLRRFAPSLINFKYTTCSSQARM